MVVQGLGKSLALWVFGVQRVGGELLGARTLRFGHHPGLLLCM